MPATEHIREANSLGGLLVNSCAKFANRIAAEPHGSKPITYRELLERVRERAGGLAALGDGPVAIIGESCFDWSLTDWAAQALGIVTVPIYPTLPPDQARHIIEDSGARVAIALDRSLLEKIEGIDGCRAVVLDELKGEMGEEEFLSRARAVSRNDTATIIYTSGTTGKPKGAILDHNAFLSLAEGVLETLPLTEEDKFLAFLPLSHVFARLGDHVLPVAAGASVAYAKSAATLAADMRRAQPTFMLVVPRFLQSVRTRVMDGVARKSGLQRALFKLAVGQGVAKAKGDFAPLFPLTDALVGAKIRASTGGRIRFFVSGGAALDPDTTRFFQAFGLEVLQGYGLTETCAATCVNHPDDNHPETVGPPIPPCEVEIAADGEILVRGPTVMKGYFNLPEDTAAAIDVEGWFHTGDIGEMVDGRLKITDRKKDLIVLGNGKNVAPQAIENRLKQSEYISEAVLFGDGMEYVCALIVPEFERLRQELGLGSDADVVQDPKAREIIKREVRTANDELADFERVKKHELVGEPFTIEGGELTPSLKVKRRFVKEKYAVLIDSMKR